MKPSLPKGTRDFSPSEMVKRNFIFKIIRKVFELYGYQPIETPAMENLSTLEGKYGEEGDKLLFRILNSGPVVEQIRNSRTEIRTSDITEKGLRYDLTVPFARYVVQHQHNITFPFKRYQIQPVWRADKPQKGRYREFYQCDADVIGSDSLLNEVELIQMINDVYSQLQIPVTIKINNRKILTGLAEKFGIKDSLNEFIASIDKLDKIEVKDVIRELETKGFHPRITEELIPLLNKQKNNPEEDAKTTINWYKKFFSDSNIEIGKRGIEEIEFVITKVSALKPKIPNLKLDITLARGLDYYTGAIFEVKANDIQIGSICGGGRYDNLTGIFGLPNVSGVGVSFGIDRIFDVMNELNLFDKLNLSTSTTKVLLAHFGEAERSYCLDIASQLRSKGINTEVYPDITKKISKQFDYANKKQIPYVIVVGNEEIKNKELTLKNMGTGEQIRIKIHDIISKLK